MSQQLQGAGQAPRCRRAFDRLEGEIRRVSRDDYVVINVDIPKAVEMVLGTLPSLKSLRPRIVKELPLFDVTRFDKLESYALALGYAHARYIVASQRAGSLEPIVRKGSALRDILLADARALAMRRLLDGKRLDGLKGTKSYRQLALDLSALATMMREGWSKISARTAIRPKELDRAEVLSSDLLTALSAREKTPAEVVEATDTRQRAFTLFVKAYDLARRAIVYLHWDTDDAEDVAPSIYAAHRAPRRRSNGGALAS